MSFRPERPSTLAPCCSRICNTMQHGLGQWLAEEVDASWNVRNELQRRVEAYEVTLDLTEQENVRLTARNRELVVMLDDSQETLQAMVRRVVTERIRARALRDQLDSARATNTLLEEQLREALTEGQALARALRRVSADVQRGEGGWIAKRPKSL